MGNSNRRIEKGLVIIMLESELVDKITDYLNKYGIRYTKEIHMGIGVPDVSINIGASKSMPLLLDYYLLLITEYISEKRKVTICDLADHFSFDKTKIQSYINQLVSEYIVKQVENVVYINRKIFGRNLGKTISIEAKIKNWKSGILQAERYLMFSDFSFLALPEEKVRNVDIELLKKSGIGLLSISESGLEEVIKPMQSLECEYKQKYIITSAIIKNSKFIVKRKGDGIFSKL